MKRKKFKDCKYKEQSQPKQELSGKLYNYCQQILKAPELTVIMSIFWITIVIEKYSIGRRREL